MSRDMTHSSPGEPQIPGPKLSFNGANFENPLSESRQTYARVMSHIRMSHVAHMNESCHTYE